MGEGWISVLEYGVPGGIFKDAQFLGAQPVREVPESALDHFMDRNTRPQFEAAFGRIPRERTEQLILILGMADAARKDDFDQALAMANRAAKKGKLVEPIAALDSFRMPWSSVGAALNAGLSGSALVLWERDSQIVPALYCRDAAMALLAHVIFRISGLHGLGICRRCGKSFSASRNRQSFCGYKCRTAEGMKRYRARLKLKESRSRKHGGRTK